MNILQKAFLWVKQNKLTAFLVLSVAYLLVRGNVVPLPIGSSLTGMSTTTDYPYSSSYAPVGLGTNRVLDFNTPLSKQISPTYDTAEVGFDAYNNSGERMMVTSSYMALHVKNTRETIDSIKDKANELGGYAIDTSVTTPLELSTGDITIRIPLKEVETFMDFARNQAIRVVSENVSGYDVTDQYTDNEARLATLNKTKARYEEFFDQATKVEELLNIQSKILNTQDQIDRIVGQQKMLEVTTQTTLITINVSEDELALPYTPEEPWSPEAVFKHAVRSLIRTSRTIASVAIWGVVYTPYVLAGFIGYKVITRKSKKQVS